MIGDLKEELRSDKKDMTSLIKGLENLVKDTSKKMEEMNKIIQKEKSD